MRHRNYRFGDSFTFHLYEEMKKHKDLIARSTSGALVSTASDTRLAHVDARVIDILRHGLVTLGEGDVGGGVHACLLAVSVTHPLTPGDTLAIGTVR